MNLNPFIILVCQSINIYLYSLLIYLVINWLRYFNLIKLNNLKFRQLYYSLERLHEEILGRVRNYISLFGNIDISPIIVYLILNFCKNILITYFYVR